MNKLYAIIQGRTMGKRFLGLLAIIIILWVLSCGLAINSMNNISNRSETTFETRVSKLDILDGINESFERSRNDSKLVYIASGSAEELSRVIPIYNETRSRLLTNLDEFNNWVNTWNGASDSEKTLTENTIKKINQAISAMDNIVMLCQNPETVDGVKSLMLSEDAIKINNDTSDAINELFTFYMNATNESNDYNIYRADKALRDISLVALAGITLAAFFFFVNVRSITIPVSELQVSLSQVANGNFNVNTSSNAKDEIGELTRDVGRVVSIFKKMSDDMLIMGREFEKGDIEYRVDDSSYTGVYKDVVTSINSLVDAIVSEVLSFIQCVGRYGDGDFTGNIPKLAGKKKVMNDAVDVLRNNLSGVSEDITYLVSHAQIGDLSVKADPNKYKGGWAHIISSLNNLLHSVEEPINEATSCISAMAEGDFKKHMQGDYKGSFNIIKVSLNKTLNTVGNYINEISEILDNIAHNNLNQELKRDYVGDFNSIKVSLNFIIETLNRFMRSIGDSSRQVASGSRHISDSSTEIAQGASVQSSSVEELTSTLSIIDRQTKSNATDAKEAHKLAMITGEHAQGGNAQMHQMLASMEEIKEASNSISKIIKVIQDIALQTNLLALNAAVEAAHAGSRGMGFAVVANEVRSLAAKSRKAAEDTELLIGDTISKIDSGTEIAVATAQSLETIIKGFDGVSSIVSRIADSSNEQVSSIENFAGNLNQISVIVNQNSATSEEAASASEELSSQSETLQNMLSVFNLRTDKN